MGSKKGLRALFFVYTRQAATISRYHRELGTLTGCSAGSNGVPTPAVTKNITVVTSVTGGVITVTTGATATEGVALTMIDTPSVAAGAANMSWLNTGTSCDALRGFRSGTGHCP